MLNQPKRPLRHLNKYFFKYRKHFFGGIAFVALSNIFSVYGAVYVRKSFDTVTDAISGGVTDKNYIYPILFWNAVIIIGAAIIRGIFMFLMRQSLIVMSRHIEYDLKNEIYHQYQILDTSFYRSNNTGDLMNRISEDVSRIRMYVGPAIMYLVNLVVMLLIVIISMLSVNVTLTLWVIAPLPFLAVSIYFVNDMIEKRSDEMQSQLSSLTSFVQETFSGLRVIKSFAKERSVAEAFDNETSTFRKKALALTLVDALWFPSILLMIGVSSILAIYIGGKQVIQHQITIGNIVEFIIYINMLSFPVASLGWAVSLIQRAKASQKRINEFLVIEPQIYNQTSKPFSFQESVKFEHVSFRYKPEFPEVLQDISFDLQKGKALGIVGTTGAGKSTIAQLLLRLYEPNSGHIYIDKDILQEVNLPDYRNHIGYVPQDVFLFSDTIKNNILFGTDEDSETIMVQAARDAAVEENILQFTDQYETMVGERGVMLSGGQKQRIAIARALAKNPSILILDDSLSAVDSETETKILQNLKKHIHKTTAVIISHRVSSVSACDEILVLDNGKITERGTHQSLIDGKGYYFRLYEKQIKEEQVAGAVQLTGNSK